MDLEEIYRKLESNHGKVCEITLKNRAILYDRIFFSVKTDKIGNLFLEISEGKSRTQVNFNEIDDILFKL